MNQIPSPQPARSPAQSSGASRSEPIGDFLLRALNHDAVADEVIELQLAHVVGGQYTQAELGAAVRIKIQDVLHAATGEDWMAVTEAFIVDGDQLDRAALCASGAGRVHAFDGVRFGVGIVRDFLAMIVTDPVAAERLATVRLAGQSRTIGRNADEVRQAVTALVMAADEEVWNEIAGRLITDALEMEAEGRLGFYDYHRQRNAERNPIAEAGEFVIGDYPAGSGVGPGGEFKVKLIELANGGRWAICPRLEAFGEGTDALRQAIDAGLLDALAPVASREEFGQRLIALGFVDRSDVQLPGREPALTSSGAHSGAGNE